MLSQYTPDLRDLFTIGNTVVLVVNVVILVYVRNRFLPITKEQERQGAILAENTRLILDTRENYKRKSDVDEEIDKIDRDLRGAFDKLETKIEGCDRKISDVRVDIARLAAVLRKHYEESNP